MMATQLERELRHVEQWIPDKEKKCYKLKKMTNTYEINDPLPIKTLEELRLIRCLLERLLNHLSSSHFKDYQMEKFSPANQHR